MRNAYVCLNCATHYLPPESMRYEQLGVDASPVHCANPACHAALADRQAVTGVPLELLERWAQRAAEQQPEPRTPRRAGRGARPATPRGARTKLR